MSKTLTLAFDCTEQEYVSAVRLWYRRRSGITFYLSLCCIFALVGVATFFLFNEIIFSAILMLVGVIGFAYLFNLYFLSPRRCYARVPEIRQDFHYEFSEQGVLLRIEKIEVNMEWSYFSGFWESAGFYFLQHNNELSNFIPKRIFHSKQHEREFKDLLKQNIEEHAQTNKWIERKADKPKLKEYLPPQTPPDWRQED